MIQGGQVAQSGLHGEDQGVPRGPQRPYEIVAVDLRRRIAAREWQPGEALPTVVALAEHYGVSKATVTRTLRILAGEGLVRVVPRWGTFAAGEPGT
jgi:DNA-binding GntR family transcriptional regulator